MSWWTYVKGIDEIRPLGRTQTEKRYILETVLDHLPRVTGTERDMNIYIVQKAGYDMSDSHSEFEQRTHLGNGRRGNFETQGTYYLLVEGSLRDREFQETYRELQKWLCRLAKRVSVEDVMIEVKGWNRKKLIRNDNDRYTKMFETVSWVDKNSINWCEYLMWKPYGTHRMVGYPEKLVEKYYLEVYRQNKEE